MRKLSFEVTDACDLNCPHCFKKNKAAGEARHIPLERLEKALVQGGRYGFEYCDVTGGEPLLHPRIEEIIARVVHHGYNWIITTNGVHGETLARLLGDPAKRDRLIFATVSLDGAASETNDLVRGKGHFRRAMKTFQTARGKCERVGLKTALNTVNIRELEALVRLAGKIGAAHLEVTQMLPTPGLIRGGLLIPRRKWGNVMRKIGRLQRAYRLPIRTVFGYKSDSILHHCMPLDLLATHFNYNGDMAVCYALTNYIADGAKAGQNIIGNIGEEDMWELHRRLFEKVAEINKARLEKIKASKVAESDLYPCIFCLHHFGNMDWLKEMDPQNEWVE